MHARSGALSIQESWAELPSERKSNCDFQYNKPGNPHHVGVVLRVVRVGVDDSSVLLYTKWGVEHVLSNQENFTCRNKLDINQSNVSVMISWPETVVPLNQSRLDKAPVCRWDDYLQWKEFNAYGFINK